MREIADLNAYLHDFTSAVWLCGSLLLWWLGRELRPLEAGTPAALALRRLAGRLKRVTLAGLAVTLLAGVGRALMFERYEHGAEVTRDVVILLAAKHALFAGLVGWGLWVHVKVPGRGGSRRTEPVGRTGEAVPS